MSENHILTTEERRKAWKAFFKNPRAPLEVYFLLALVAYFVYHLWGFDSKYSWFDVIRFGYCAVLLFCLLVITLTYDFGIFHGIMKKYPWLDFSRMNPYKLIECSKHPLFPTGWKYAMYVALGGVFFMLLCVIIGLVVLLIAIYTDYKIF